MRTSTHPAPPVVPDLDLPESPRPPASRPALAAPPVIERGSFEIESAHDHAPLELAERADLPRREIALRVGCPVCTTECGRYARLCAGCGERFEDASPAPIVVTPFGGGPYRSPAVLDVQSAPSSLGGALDTLAVVPMAVWKRVAGYTLLAMFIGNVLRCRGLSTSANLVLAALVVLGIVGCIASAQKEGA